MNPFASALFAAAGPVGSTSTFSLSLTDGALPAGITASGGANGRAVNVAGLCVPAVAPRFDYHPATHSMRGLLVEPAASNLCLQSQSFDAAAWDKASVSITANAATAPDGSPTADLVVAGSTGAYLDQAVATVPSAAFSYSCYFKPGNFQWLRLVVQSASGGQSAQFWFDLVNRVAGVSTIAAGSPIVAGHGAEDAGGGWVRCWATVQLPAEATALMVLLAATGNGATTQPEGAQYYAWGAQIEQGMRPTSYVGPTTGATVTRSADAIGLIIPAGTTALACTFDDGSQQVLAVVPGPYTVPTGLARARIARITGTA